MIINMALIAMCRMVPVVGLVFACIFSAFCEVDARFKKDPPKWPDSYSVSGTIQLPYAEIKEPFYAYYSSATGRSRIDYYDMVRTVQIAAVKKDYGKSYKVAPMTTENVTNAIGCFLLNGTKEGPTELQSVLPDLKGYHWVKQEKQGKKDCDLWQNITVVGTRKNVYSFWSEVGTNEPVRFEMMGYDTLLGSHYDKYYLDYDQFTDAKVPDDVFDIKKIAPSKTICGGFPGPGMEDHKLLMNPMQEYVNSYSDHLDPMFQHFRKHHKRNYNWKEAHSRKSLFMHNLRFVHSTNRAGLSYRVAINHLADWTDEERKALRGRRAPKGYNGGLPFNKHKYNLKDLPDQLDWRLYGAVAQVKDQAVCGSCWSFGTTGTIEGAYFLKTGTLVRLSQQELIDCSWGEGNNGCDGGEDFRAYQWITKHGLAAEDAYGDGNYLGQDSYCSSKNATAVVKTIKAYFNVTTGDDQALKVALAQHGPISVAIDAAVRSFSFYANGVYDDPKCGNKPDDLDHAVLAVGYGALNGKAYWLVKNSWSTYWGNDGYVLIAQKNHICGVTTDPTFVQL